MRTTRGSECAAPRYTALSIAEDGTPTAWSVHIFDPSILRFPGPSQPVGESFRNPFLSALAERVGIHVSQLRRYEAGTSRPTLDALRNLAIALTVTTDALVFGADERGPQDDLRLKFEALQRLNDQDKNVIRTVLDAILLRADAKRWTHAR